MRHVLNEERKDLEEELEMLRKGQENLQNEVVEKRNHVWREDFGVRKHAPLQGGRGEEGGGGEEAGGSGKAEKGAVKRLPDPMYRYSPAKNDSIDKVLAECINSYKPPIPFFRLSQGIYLYGSRKVLVKLTKQGKPIFRVGGGYCSFEEFIDQFSKESLLSSAR